MSNRKQLEMKSGFSVSCQASQGNYCSPKNNTGPYDMVELGFPNAVEPLIAGFAEDPDNPTGTVYGWVPAHIVKALIMKHGGLVAGELPPLAESAEDAGALAETLFSPEFRDGCY